MTGKTKLRLAAIFAGAALVSSCQSASAVWSEAAPLSVSADACRRDPDPYFRSSHRALQVTPGNAERVRAICAEVIAHPERISASELMNALYFAGAANRILAAPTEDGALAPEAADRLRDGEDYLERALALRDDFNFARLERARVYKLQARLTGARAPSRDALQEVEELQRRIPDPGDPVHAAAHFLRASIFLDLHTTGPSATDAVASIGGRSLSNNTHEDVLPTLTWDSTLRDLAVFADSAHAWSSDHREHPDRAKALQYLAQYADQLGCFLTPCDRFQIVETWSGERLTRESVQRAIDYFSMAQIAVDAVSTEDYAHPMFVQTYAHLGKAEIALAGLLSERQSAAYGCVPDVANQAMLAQAASDMAAAAARTPADGSDRQDAELGLACAKLALGDTGAARAAADASVVSGSAASYLMLARVHAVREDWASAVRDYSSAANVALGDTAALGVINLERARTQLQSPPQELIADEAFERPGAALSDAQTSLFAANPSARERPVAQLELGKLHYFMKFFPTALEELQVFEAQHEAGAYEDRRVRAQALLFLSRIRTELGAGAAAVRNADDAFSLDGSWPYREQACLARIRFGQVLFSTAGPRAICAAADDAPIGEGALLEGMYHLRRAFLLRAGDRSREWEDAYRAFDQGVASIGTVAATPENQDLRDRLQYGRGTAQFCIGFAEIGNQAIQAIGDQSRIDKARAHFAVYGVSDCPTRR